MRSRAAPKRVVSQWLPAGLHLRGDDEHDQAISWLEHAAEDRDSVMTNLKTLLMFDPLRSDPSFQALLKKMNFPAQA